MTSLISVTAIGAALVCSFDADVLGSAGSSGEEVPGARQRQRHHESEEPRPPDHAAAALEEELAELELTVPNLLDDRVPEGEDESANRVERERGERPSFDFEPKAHWDLGAELGVPAAADGHHRLNIQIHGEGRCELLRLEINEGTPEQRRWRIHPLALQHLP